jgi:hypothetical protein
MKRLFYEDQIPGVGGMGILLPKTVAEGVK